MTTETETALLLGVLIGEGSFTINKGKYPIISVKMNERHLPLLEWVQLQLPGSTLHGPYDGSGILNTKPYYQLHCRHPDAVQAACEKLDDFADDWREIDPHSFHRYESMRMNMKFLTHDPL